MRSRYNIETSSISKQEITVTLTKTALMAVLQAQLTSKLPFGDLKSKRGHSLQMHFFLLLI